ncbi:g9879 [Coccomyxa elongata]
MLSAIDLWLGLPALASSYQHRSDGLSFALNRSFRLVLSRASALRMDFASVTKLQTRLWRGSFEEEVEASLPPI